MFLIKNNIKEKFSNTPTPTLSPSDQHAVGNAELGQKVLKVLKIIGIILLSVLVIVITGFYVWNKYGDRGTADVGTGAVAGTGVGTVAGTNASNA